MYLIIATIIISIILLLIYFDGKMRILKAVQPTEEEIADGMKSKF
jgi:hypothetical protein